MPKIFYTAKIRPPNRHRILTAVADGSRSLKPPHGAATLEDAQKVSEIVPATEAA
jgi:hypothetical protein